MGKVEIEKIHSDDLIVPLYVDTNKLLDLLASIEGGFSSVEKVSTRTTIGKASEGSIKGDAGTEFGFPNVLNLLKINISASKSKKKAEDHSEEREFTRYHTYGSLLHRLRKLLDEQNLIKNFDGSEESWNNINPTNFVEIRGVFRINPLGEYFEVFTRLLDLYQLIQGVIPEANPPNNKQKHGNSALQPNQAAKYKKFSQGLTKELNDKKQPLLVVDLNGSTKHKAVVTLVPEYLGELSLEKLSQNEYLLLGKVVRKLEDADVPIDLLAGTSLGGISSKELDKLVASLNEAGVAGMNLPKAETKIIAPALQIVPIAIYV